MRKALFLVVFLFSVFAVAQVTSPAPASSPLPLSGAVTAVTNTANKVPSNIPSGVLMLITFLLSTEVGMRIIPTQKAYSWAIALAALLGAVILLLQKAQNLCTTMGQSLQNISSPPAS